MERMTDGQVPFHRKRYDGQHRRVRGPVQIKIIIIIIIKDENGNCEGKKERIRRR